MTAVKASFRLPFPLTLEPLKCAILPSVVALMMTTRHIR